MMADHTQGEMPIHLAAESGHTEVLPLPLLLFLLLHALTHAQMVRLLLDHGAEVNAVARGLTTPLFFAAQSGHVPTIELLIERVSTVTATLNCGL
jgi:ankyrin repeat protein